MRHHVRVSYDVVAQSYADLLPDTTFEAPEDLALIDDLIAGLPERSRVLDAGCGAGRMLAHLAALDRTLALTGIDISSNMVELARRHNPGATVDVGDLAALPYPDSGFDAALAWYSLIHAEHADIPGWFAELRRVVRRGAPLLVAVHAGQGRRHVTRAYGHDVDLVIVAHDVDHLASMLRAAGFVVEACVERPARSTERGPQGFVLARRL